MAFILAKQLQLFLQNVDFLNCKKYIHNIGSIELNIRRTIFFKKIKHCRQNMASWSEIKLEISNEQTTNDSSFDIIQEYIDDTSFNSPKFEKIFEQVPVYTTNKLCDENSPESSSYIGKLEGHDENAG